ncbi:MAG: hypothetical protein KatS3mg083_125 [Candidatus Dojkabacteria bacterium]|nr:MAG: hypothetical protein KatS3mg083_125 [Candidatus Dojkabacteria bacterium]
MTMKDIIYSKIVDNYSTRIHKVIYPHSSWGVLMDIIWNDAYEREEYKNTTDMGGIIKCFVINRTKRYILSDVTDDGEFDNILGELSFNNPIGVNKILNERGEIVNYAAADLYKWDDFKIKYYPCSGRKLGREYLMTRYDRIWGRKSSAADKTYLLQDNKNQPEDHVPVVSWYYRFVWDFGNEEFSAPSAPLGVNDIMWSVIKDDIIEQSVYLGQFNDPLQRIKGYREARPFKLSDDDAINSIMYAFDNDTEIDGIDVLADFQYETISERKQTASSALVSPLTDFEYKRLPKLLAFNYNLAVNGERVRDIVNQIYEALYDWYDKNDTVEYLAVTSYVTHQDHFKLLSGNLVEYFRLFVTSDLGGANPEISTFTVQRAGTLGLIVPLYKEEGNSLTYNAVFSDIEVEDENGKTRLGGYYRLAYQRKDNLEPEWIILNNAHVGAYATVPDYPFYIASPIFSDIRVKSGKKYALHDFSGQIVWHGVNYPIVKNAPVHLKIDFTDDDFLEVLPNFESLPANIKNNILGQTKLNGMYYPITGILPYWEAFEDNNNILHSVPDWFRLTYNQFGQPINPPFNLPSWVVALHEDLNSKYVHDIDGLNNGKIEIIDFTNVLHFNVVPVPEDYNNISVSFEESEFGNIWHRTKTTLRFIKSPQKNFERFRDGVPQEVIDRILLRGVAQLVISNFGDRIAHASSAYIMPTSHMMNITDDDGGGVAPQLSRNFIIDRNALDYKYVRSIYDTHNSILSTAYRGANNVNGLFLWRREVDKAEFKGIGGFDDVYITEYDANMLYQGRIRTDHGIGQVFVDFYPNMYKLLYPPLGAPQIYNNMYVNNGAIPLNSKFLFYVYSVFEDNFLIGSLDNIALIPQAHYADVKELRDLYIHDNFKVVLHLEGARLTIPEQITSYIPSSLLFEAPRVKIRIPFNKVPRRARRLLIFRTKSALSNDYHPSKYGLVATVDISKKSFFDSTTGNNFTLNDNIEFFDDVPDSKLDFTYNIEDYNGITTPLKSVTNIVIANRAFYGNVEETYYPPSPPGMNKMPVTMLPSRYVCNYELYGGNIFNRIDAVGSIGIAPLIVYDDDIAEHQAQFNYYWKVDKDAFDNLYADTYNGFIDSSHGCVVYYFACIDKENNISRFRYAFLHRVSIHQDIVNAWDNLQTQRKKLVFAITNMAELWDESLGGIAVYRALLYPDVSYEVLINLPGLPPDAQLELVAYVKNVYDGIIVDYGKVVENQSVPTVWTNYEVRLRLDDYNRNSYVAFPRVEPIKKHYPSTIIYSDVGTTNRIRLYNRIELDEGDGDAIIRMTMAYGNILVFKENSAYRLVITPGTSDIGRIDKLTTEYGLIAPNAIYSNGNDVYFLSNRGLVLYDHNKFERIDLPVSSDISNRLKHHLGIRIQDSTIRDSSIGYNVHYNELYLNIPVWTTKQPDYYYEFADRWGHVFVLNMRYNMWTKFQYMPGDKTYYYKYGEKDRPDNPIIPTWQRSFARIYCTTPNGYLISGEVLPKYHVMVTNIREKVMPTCFYLESPTGLGYDIVAAGIDNTYARDNVLLNRSDGFFYFEHPTESSFSLIVREDVLAIWRSPGFVLGNRTWINRIRKIIVEVNSKKEIVVCNEVKNLALRMKQRSKSVFPIDGQVVFIPDFSEGMDRGNYLNIEVQTKGNSELISIAFYARVTNTWMR